MRPADPRPAGLAAPETLIALGVILLAGIVFWQATQIPTSAAYARVGPRIFPFMVAAALGLLGAALLVDALRGGWQDEAERSTPVDWGALGLVLLGLLANIVLLAIGSPWLESQQFEIFGMKLYGWPQLGFTIASTVMFTLVAAGFGSRNLVRDALIGATFALVAYFGFAKTLDINIGAGVLEAALDPYVEELRGLVGRAIGAVRQAF